MSYTDNLNDNLLNKVDTVDEESMSDVSYIFPDNTTFDHYVNTIVISEGDKNKERNIRDSGVSLDKKLVIREMLKMGYSLEMITKCLYYYKDSVKSLEEVCNLLTLDNGVWQHNFFENGELFCDICKMNIDHLDYKTKEFHDKVAEEDLRLSGIIKKKLQRKTSVFLVPMRDEDVIPIDLTLKKTQSAPEKTQPVNLYSESIHENNRLYQGQNNAIENNYKSTNFKEDTLVNNEIMQAEVFERKLTPWNSGENVADMVSIKYKNEEKIEEVECEVCYSYYPKDSKEIMSLSCLHYFCTICWKDFIVDKIRNSKVGELNCMRFKCPEKIPNDKLEMFMDAELKKKYDKFVVQNFVKNSDDKTFCPVVDCGGYAHTTFHKSKKKKDYIEDNPDKYVTCNNGHQFCFVCKGKWHANTKCEEKVDKSFNKYIKKTNPKKCPTCGCFVVKIEGCNQMTCGNCKARFCWICLSLCEYDHFSNFGSTCYGLLGTDNPLILYLYQKPWFRKLKTVLLYFFYLFAAPLILVTVLAFAVPIGCVFLTNEIIRRKVENITIRFIIYATSFFIGFIFQPLLIVLALSIVFTFSAPVTVYLLNEDRSYYSTSGWDRFRFVLAGVLSLIFQPFVDALALAIILLACAFSPILGIIYILIAKPFRNNRY